MLLRMYWDGETDPSIDTPLGDFWSWTRNSSLIHLRKLPPDAPPLVGGEEGGVQRALASWIRPFP